MLLSHDKSSPRNNERTIFPLQLAQPHSVSVLGTYMRKHWAIFYIGLSLL